MTSPKNEWIMESIEDVQLSQAIDASLVEHHSSHHAQKKTETKLNGSSGWWEASLGIEYINRNLELVRLSPNQLVEVCMVVG